MRTHTRTVLIACAAAGAIAVLGVMCAPPTGNDSSALTPPGVGPCQAYAISRCERMDACTGGVWVAQFFGSRAACEQHVADACALRVSAPGMTVTSAGIDACTEALTEASCADFFGGVAACHPAAGTLANGESCTYPLQCASAWCDRMPGAGCGVCAARPTMPTTVPCGGTTCTSPAFCMMGRCAIPIASYAAPTRAPGAIPGLVPGADPRLALGVEVAAAAQCEGGCGAGFTCMGITIPSVSDPAQHTTRFGCAPTGSDPIACAGAGLALDPTTGECELTADALPLAGFVPPSQRTGPIDGLTAPADPRLAASIEVAGAAQCESGCAAGFTCMSITIPSVSDPAQSTTRFGCAPVAAPTAAVSPTAAYAAPTRTAGSIPGLVPAADPRLAVDIEIALDQQQCEGGCGAGFTCLSISIPSVSDPSQRTIRFGCAPAGADPLASAIPAASVSGPTTRAPGPIDGLEPFADPRLAGGVDIAMDGQQCDDGRSCGAGYTCMSMTVPSISDPFHTTTRYGCAPASPDAFACARAGLILNTATGECQTPVVASPGEVCGASRPGVVCGEGGRCVRAPQSASVGVCVAASPYGGECFADRWRGPGCMAPAYCARAPGAEVGTCARPLPALCGE